MYCNNPLWLLLWSFYGDPAGDPITLRTAAAIFILAMLFPASLGWQFNCFLSGTRHGTQKLRTLL